MADENIIYLFDRYISRTCTPAEKHELAVLGLMPENQPVIDALFKEHWEQTGLDETMPDEKGFFILAVILGKQLPMEKTEAAPIIRFRWRKLAIAASILLIIGLGSYFLFFNKPAKQNEVVKAVPATDVEAPKVTKATITLADGRTISIDSITSGMLSRQSNVTVTKTASGKIVYAGNADEIVYNTLNNPRGSKVIDMDLSDGSHVWLNAGSSITFPVAFTGNERKVSVTGEAYFEVTHDKTKPFYVNKSDVQVEVLGTHFNVNAYDDEGDIKITLLEGSVKITKGGLGKVLKPGQQARVVNNVSIANEIDVDEIMAWKNGRFQFNKANVETIMREVSRWYDVEVVYAGRVPDAYFRGEIPRTASLSQTLKILESSGVKTKIKGRKVIIE